MLQRYQAILALTLSVGLFPAGALGQVIPPGLQDSIDALSASINSLNQVMVENNFQGAEQSLSKAADALQTLANFSTTVESNTTPIAFASIGVLVTGIVVGQFLSKNIFTLRKDRNLLYMMGVAIQAYISASSALPIEEAGRGAAGLV